MQSIESFFLALAGIAEGPPPAHIVLMSDGGKQTVPGLDGENEPRGAFTAARRAAELGIPISTIAFGTEYGTIDIHGERTPVPIDAPAMLG